MTTVCASSALSCGLPGTTGGVPVAPPPPPCMAAAHSPLAGERGVGRVGVAPGVREGEELLPPPLPPPPPPPPTLANSPARLLPALPPRPNGLVAALMRGS